MYAWRLFCFCGAAALALTTHDNEEGLIRYPAQRAVDCRAIGRPFEELHRAVEQKKVGLTGFIHKEHDELRRTLDPTVVRLRKRRKILVHKDAFEDL